MTTEFRRDTALARLAAEQFDVLVIGGGITGAGVALDAASRGLRTALVDKGDFASGTSSKSSKMVHGGIRYLQQRELRLVYENLAERQRLLDNAPHLVSPLPFLIPLFGRNGVVSKTVARSYAAALWLYDLTGGFRIGARHRRVGKQEALDHLPTLRTDRLVAGFLYFDARADDARLTLAVLRTAVLDHGAVAANYTRAVSFLTDHRGRVAGARVSPAVRPGATGSFGEVAEGPDFDVRATVVVNATGVWADRVAALDDGGNRPTLRPAKGVHLTVPAAKLPCDIAAVIPVPADKRSIFVVPWPEGDLTYIGTTDTDYTGSLDHPTCTPDDVTYLLRAVNAATTSDLSPTDVTGVWAGLRPLLAPSGGTRRLSERTADLSRRHTVTTSPEGVVTVTGGKLTTYRKMAQDTMDQVVPLLAPDRAPGAARCVTARLPLRGAPGGRQRRRPRPGRTDGTGNGAGAGGAGTTSPGSGAGGPVPGGPVPGSAVPGGAVPGGAVPGGAVDHLWSRYGTEADAVRQLAEERPELAEPVVPGLPYLGAEVVYAARAEMAQSLDDVLSRRTRALLQQARASAAVAGRVADLLAPELGWSPEQAADQATRFAAEATAGLEAAGIPTGGSPAGGATGGGSPAGGATAGEAPAGDRR
ncbi:MAG TPA: glycerol-3-phosphate dehydrogenase/oxidase [Acidimicrobiales bacterium]|nr:glycerol-3-phosphate dehydrogenase/oxidase [Acidimicrobiales bacterium]